VIPGFFIEEGRNRKIYELFAVGIEDLFLWVLNAFSH
jgi:hypothetical protein